MTVNILGTNYTIIKQKESENAKLLDANGLCEIYAKKIILRELEEDSNNFENLDAFKRRVLRHEIIHAFFAESGLRASSDYAQNEELVDWIAIQYPKIQKVFEKLGIEED